MESRKPSGLDARRARTPLLPMPRLCLRPDGAEADRADAEAALFIAE